LSIDKTFVGLRPEAPKECTWRNPDAQDCLLYDDCTNADINLNVCFRERVGSFPETERLSRL